jgi:hypothetical protein
MATLKTTDGNPNLEKTKWDRVQEMDEFRLLILAKKEFVIPRRCSLSSTISRFRCWSDTHRHS